MFYPVSYTHLDVYKRQSHGIPCSDIRTAREAEQTGANILPDIKDIGTIRWLLGVLNTKNQGARTIPCLLYTSVKELQRQLLQMGK